ncbi:hypothetical protein ABBQ32_011459 [Trebouxia sp. C0010 RCD-2024]
MKTRKRTLSEANSSSVTARVATRNFVCSAEAPLLLRKHGYIQELIPNSTTDTLRIVVKAFQAQLEAWSQQPPQHRYAGFKQLAKKQRVEFRAGDSTLGQLGLLQSIAVTVVQALDDIARGVLEGLAKALQLPADAFLPVLDQTAVDTSKQSASSLEAIHYMLPERADEKLGAPACEAHEDKGLLTLIYSDIQQGLQVQKPCGTWTHVLLPQGLIAVLTGHTLERATCGLVKAAKHRVLVGAPGGCPTPRNALVYKLRAPETAVLNMYNSLSRHVIIPRYRTPIGVSELMHHFNATHTSVNATPSSEEPLAARHTNTLETGSTAPLAAREATAKTGRLRSFSDMYAYARA